MNRLLLLIGAFGVLASASVVLWFLIQSSYYFPDRYEDALRTYFYVLVGWGIYGFVCALSLIWKFIFEKHVRKHDLG
ncbi:MAG: hypothetical protein AB8D78_03540 [Akkermansiaceae bacterium]